MQISLENLTMRYGKVTAVDDVSLEIEAGEMMVLLGPSGCGKTSTMRSIVGLETPVAGRIRIGDDVVFDAERGINVPPNKRNIGMVFQSYAIWPHKTVAQNVEFPLRMQGVSGKDLDKRTEEALEVVGLEGYGERGASQLSGGQMQRVALARSIVMRPKVLLLDEPLSNLDAKLRDRLRFELKAIQEELDLTSVYVTHDQAEALALADRVAVMRTGRIVQNEPPAVIYHEPANRFVADFLGVTNIWSATIIASDGGLVTARLEDFPLDLRCQGTAPVGTEVSVCLRPEASRLYRTPPAEGSGNVVKGRVVFGSFLGTHGRYGVQADGGPMLDIIAYGEDSLSFHRGDEVFVSIAQDAIRLLDAGDARAGEETE
jgi:iron(III) transport system ATP-binding protein